MTVDQDTEITLGTGKMLALFFGLVALCAVFFGVGYSLGRSSSRPVLAADAAGSPAAGAPRSTTAKPATPDNATKPSDLTFYKTVEQKDADPQLTPADAGSTPPALAPAQNTNTPTQPAPPDPATIAGTSSYYVQVAAVTKEEDAQALVDALRKKQYPAFTNSAATDKLFHVQVGPYADIKDAEAMRGKLISDGYNPILKK
ncbi:MAG TPA: SPOR domain-containing protein [Terriglobales bacterium]|nr:SPOR domain-containing protein [Terriglobales bacterium]